MRRNLDKMTGQEIPMDWPRGVVRVVCGLMALAVAACGPSGGGDVDTGGLSVRRVVLALKPDKDPSAMQEEQRKLSAFLSGKLGTPVEVIIPLADAVIEEGFANGTIDMAYVSGGTMWRVWSGKSAEILLAGEINGRTDYESYWVSLKEKPYEGVESLRGRRIAFASPSSTSGNLVPHWDLIKKGLIEKGQPAEAFFGNGNVLSGTGYVSAVERVLGGEAEAAAVSYYVLDEDKHLTADQRGRLKKVASQGPVPTHAIAVRASLPEADKSALKEAMLALNDAGSEALRDRVFTSKLVEVEAEAHLAPLEEAFEWTTQR